MDWKSPAMRARLALALVLAALTWAAYWGVWRCEFVDYDDPDYVTQNHRIRRGLTWAGIGWAFGSAELANWHPITWLSHMADCQVYGLKSSGHHVTNLLLHLANTVLLFAVGVRMTNAGVTQTPPNGRRFEGAASTADRGNGISIERLFLPAWVAALFAVHPLHVESVAWVSERKDVLSTFFFLLTLLAYARCVERCRGTAERKPGNGTAGWGASIRGARFDFALALGFFVLGLMSKPMVVTLPCLLLLLDWWPLGRWSHEGFWRLFREKIPFFVLSAVFSLVTLSTQAAAGAVSSLSGFTVGQRIANALISYVRYLRKTFWPDDLAVFYPHPGDWPLWQALGAGLVLAGWTAVTVRWAGRRPWLLVGWLWFLGTLVPVIGLVQVGLQSLADRYTYIPLIGLFVVLSGALAEAAMRLPKGKWVFGGVAVAAVGACSVATRAQLMHWRNTETLFAHALRVTRNNDVAHNSLGAVRYQQGRIEEAIAHFQEAVRLRPTYAEAHNNLGALLEVQGRVEEAIAHLRRAIELNPKNANAHNNLGLALLRLGQNDAAAAHFEQAIRINPFHARAMANLARLRTNAGQHQAAVELCRRALEIEPDFHEARPLLAAALVDLGRTNAAIRELETALQQSPENPFLHNKLGGLLLSSGRVEEALEHFRRAVERAPDYADARSNLGLALTQLGRLEEAIREYREALRFATNQVVVQNNLGLALAQKGLWEEAAAAFDAVSGVEPENSGAHFNLGNVRMAQNRPADALTHYRECVRLRPDFALAHHHLGLALRALGRLEEAAASLEEALRLRPEIARIHNDLGLVRALQGRFEDAAVEFERALQFGAEPVLTFHRLGRARAAQGRFGEAIAAYRRALELQPDSVEALNDLAWLLATCHDPQYRDGVEAVRLAERAAELTRRQDPGKLDTLAAALAEAGRFEQAVMTAREALALAQKEAAAKLVGEISERLKRFESGQTYHEPR